MVTSYLTVCPYVCTITLIMLIESSSAACDGQLSLTGPKMAAMMNRTYPLCRDADLRFELPICELGEYDVSDTCRTTAGTIPCLKSTCPDGTWNRTCHPQLRNDVIYALSCACRSAVHIPDDVKATNWSGMETLSPPVGGAFFHQTPADRGRRM